MEPTLAEQTRLIPIAKLPPDWPFSYGAMRHYAFNSANNRADEFGVFLRIGSKDNRRRVLVDEQQFYCWLRSIGLPAAAKQNSSGAA